MVVNLLRVSGSWPREWDNVLDQGPSGTNRATVLPKLLFTHYACNCQHPSKNCSETRLFEFLQVQFLSSPPGLVTLGLGGCLDCEIMSEHHAFRGSIYPWCLCAWCPSCANVHTHYSGNGNEFGCTRWEMLMFSQWTCYSFKSSCLLALWSFDYGIHGFGYKLPILKEMCVHNTKSTIRLS